MWSPARAAPSDTRQPRELCSRSMDDCRVALHRARAAAHISEAARVAARMEAEAARLNAEADAAVAVRAAGVSLWASELPPLFLQQVLDLLQWEPAACAAVRAVCSTWGGIHDALRCGRLHPQRAAAVMEGKIGWFQSVTEVDLTDCFGASAVLAELGSVPSLCSLPSSCAERAVDAEAVCGLTTLTTLRIYEVVDEDGEPVEEVGEWVLDLSRLTTLTALNVEACDGQGSAGAEQPDGLTDLNLSWCSNVTSEVLVLRKGVSTSCVSPPPGSLSLPPSLSLCLSLSCAPMWHGRCGWTMTSTSQTQTGTTRSFLRTWRGSWASAWRVSWWRRPPRAPRCVCVCCSPAARETRECVCSCLLKG